jgi:uncharacterized membrane protein YccC
MKAGEHWHYLGAYFHRFDAVIGAVIVIAVVWFVWTHWKHRMRAAS